METKRKALDWDKYDVCPECRAFVGERCHYYEWRTSEFKFRILPCGTRRTLPKYTDEEVERHRRVRRPLWRPTWETYAECETCGASDGQPCVTVQRLIGSPKANPCKGRIKKYTVPRRTKESA